MPRSMTQPAAGSHRVIGEMRPAMAKADVPKGEKREIQAQIGVCLDEARRVVGWTVDQLAGELGKDSKQVARWMRGEENVQMHVVFAVVALRAPFLVALAKLADCEIETTVRIRVTA